MQNQEVHIVGYSIPVTPQSTPFGTWRDELAKAAMQGLLAFGGGTYSTSADVIAKLAYRQADAMLKERG